MKTVMMAGGMGTRIQSVAGDIPKAMLKIAGKPILLHQIDNLRRFGLCDITIVVGHLGDQIKAFLGNGSSYGVDIKYITETQPMGTAGGLYYLASEFSEDFLLLNGDIIFDIDFGRFISFHQHYSSNATLFVHPNSHPYDSDLCVMDGNKIIDWHKKNQCRDFYYNNVVNAGIYILSPALFKQLPTPQKTDLDKQIIAKWVMEGSVFGYKSSEYCKDIGTPDRLTQAELDLKNGIVKAKSYSNKQKAFFLDRDGTINKFNDFISEPHQLVLLDGASEAIKLINESGYLAIVITNQPVIARGDATTAQLEEIHRRLETLLGLEGAYIDDLFYCPHHPDNGFKGEIEAMKIDCNCRKPKPGMILAAAKKHNIALSSSYMIGDSDIDIECGKNAGVSTILTQNLLESVKKLI